MESMLTTDMITQLGFGAIFVYFAYLVIEKVINLATTALQKRNGNGKPTQQETIAECKEALSILRGRTDRLEITQHQIADLHRWHDVRNADGAFLWYMPTSLEKAIESLAENLRAMTAIQAERTVLLREQCRTLDRVEKKVST